MGVEFGSTKISHRKKFVSSKLMRDTFLMSIVVIMSCKKKKCWVDQWA